MSYRRSAYALLSVLFALSACDRIRSVIGGNDGADGAASGAAAATSLPSFAGFEGEIDLMMKSSDPRAGGPHTVNLLVKNDKIRADLPPGIPGTEAFGGKVYGVLDTPDKKLFAVLDARKEVVVIDLNKAGEHLRSFSGPGSHGSSGPSSPPPKVTKTGHKDTVAGTTCEDWEVVPADGKGKMMVCVAEAGGVSFFHLPLTGIPTEHAWMLELLDGNHFPLRAITYEDNVEKSRIEVTKLDKHPEDASLFAIPAGYKVLDVQQMIASMGAGGMGGMSPHPKR